MAGGVYSVERVGGRWHIFKNGEQEPGDGWDSKSVAQQALNDRLQARFRERGKVSEQLGGGGMFGKKKITAEAVKDNPNESPG